MRWAQAGERNHQWKGGKTVTSHGYVLVKRPGHPDADCRGYVYEHRLVAAATLARPLLPGEHVHHLNGDRLDNRPENLAVLSQAEHGVAHRKRDSGRRLPGEENVAVSCACGCGAQFERFDRWQRPRKYLSGHNMAEGRGRAD